MKFFWLGLWIYLSVMSYIAHLNGDKSIFFEDTDEIERNKTEIRRLKTELELKKLREALKHE